MLGGRKVRSNKGLKRSPYGPRKKHRKTRSNKGVKRGQYGPRKKSMIRTPKKVSKKNVNKVIEKSNNKYQCEIIDVNGEKHILENEYPGDEWVHEHLMENRDVDLKYYQKYHPELLTEAYHTYNNLCR